MTESGIPSRPQQPPRPPGQYQPPAQPPAQPSARPLGRRQFLTRTGLGGLVIGLGAVAAGQLASPASPAAAATAFGVTSSGGFYTVSTGAGLTFKIRQSTGGMTSLNINGTELQPT